jgi:hypothetical protein
MRSGGHHDIASQFGSGFLGCCLLDRFGERSAALAEWG